MSFTMIVNFIDLVSNPLEKAELFIFAGNTFVNFEKTSIIAEKKVTDISNVNKAFLIAYSGQHYQVHLAHEGNSLMVYVFPLTYEQFRHYKLYYYV